MKLVTAGNSLQKRKDAVLARINSSHKAGPGLGTAELPRGAQFPKAALGY